MRWWPLYLRARSVPASFAVMLCCAIALWWGGQALHNEQYRGLLALLAVVAATVAIAPGLAGADHDLEKGAAIAWPPRRAGHVVVAGAVLVGLFALTGQGSGGQLVRDVIGLGGLVALGATVLGALRAPLLPIVWTALVLRFAPPLGIPPARPTYKVMLTWMTQPAGTRAATVAALILGVAGTLAYALFGARPSR
jgi:hypothetical protein